MLDVKGTTNIDNIILFICIHIKYVARVNKGRITGVHMECDNCYIGSGVAT